LLDVGYLREWASVLGVLEDLNLGMEQVKIWYECLIMQLNLWDF
jgi:hypothetical protein